MAARCNFRCKYCYGDYANRRQELIATEEALKLLDELADWGMQYLQLSGGEPLMFPGVEQLVDRACARGICLGISTNGSLIPAKINVVKKLQTVCISLDGDEATHDANRGKGTYRQAMTGLEAARQAGVRVHIYCTVTRHNV
ncbi:MAG: radical SAM protein [Verrucomicrobiae bacterium]|nr:radical SAM protein [Verrucomicrobiae bacterium]